MAIGAFPEPAVGMCFLAITLEIVLTLTWKMVKFLKLGAFSGANSANGEAQKSVLQALGYSI